LKTIIVLEKQSKPAYMKPTILGNILSMLVKEVFINDNGKTAQSP